MVLPQKYYDFVKWFVGIVLPAISAAVFSLQETFNIDNAEQIMGVCAVLATFLGAIAGISSRNFNRSDAAYDGYVVVTNPDDGPKNFSLELNKEPADLEAQTSIRMKVVEGPTGPPVDDVA